MSFKSLVFLSLAFLCAAFSARAIGPHEILLVVNEESLDSLYLARVYQRLRSVPDTNMLRVALPLDVYDGRGVDISHADFTKHIWGPVSEALARQETRHVLAVVLSCGFPTRVIVKDRVPISITGAVFLRNALPESDTHWDSVDKGLFASELFAGSFNVATNYGESETFDTSRARLIANMPLPAMMLGFTGERGTTADQAVAYLERAATGDHTRPAGTIWFAVNDDVRSKCRHEWIFPQATNLLASVPGVRAVVSAGQPGQNDYPLLGYMTGSRNTRGGMLFAPGAFADHLTSWGASFEQSAQSKVTDWLKNGAAFTAGTVTEPYAVWTKFPHACLFTHYMNGCSAIEALYLSVFSPLQLLPLGDPLANPWAEKITMQIEAPRGDLSGQVDLKAVIENESSFFYRYNWYIDGKPAGTGRNLIWDTAGLPDGTHKIRAVARRQLESVRQQGFAEITVKVRN